MKDLARSLGLERGLAQAFLEARWKEVVGPQIASHTHPLEIRFDTLVLLVDKPVWMHELSFLKREIIEKANAHLGKVWIRNIHLKIGPIPVSSKPVPERQRSPVALGKGEMACLNRHLSAISDPGLKEVIDRAIRRHLQAGDEGEESSADS